MSQELTHAEWLRCLADIDAVHAGRETKRAERLRTIASILATETPGIASYCGDRLVAIQCDQRDGDDYRTMLAVPVTVTVRPA